VGTPLRCPRVCLRPIDTLARFQFPAPPGCYPAQGSASKSGALGLRPRHQRARLYTPSRGGLIRSIKRLQSALGSKGLFATLEDPVISTPISPASPQAALGWRHLSYRHVGLRTAPDTGSGQWCDHRLPYSGRAQNNSKKSKNLESPRAPLLLGPCRGPTPPEARSRAGETVGEVCKLTNLAKTAYAQLLVTTRLLDSVHDRIARLSRMQRIYPCAR
jgi:hypothetical protein